LPWSACGIHGEHHANDILFDDFADFTATRERLDALILDFSNTLNDELLTQPIHYRNMAGEEYGRPLAPLFQHLFNHRTHHPALSNRHRPRGD